MTTATKQNKTAERVTLTGLRVESFKRIRAVRITPDGSPLVKITGANGAGKSSVLDAIETLLGGGRHAPEKPVRRGAKKATIEGATSAGYTIRRTYTEAGSHALEVLGPDGEPIKSPQAFLDGLIGNGLALDPMKFLRMEPRQQVEEIKRVAGIDESLAEIERKRGEAQAAKTQAARDARTLELQLVGLPETPGPDDVVSMSQLSEQLTAAQEVIGKHQQWRRGLEERRRKIVELRAEIDKQQAHLEVLQKAMSDLTNEVAKFGPQVEAATDPDIAGIKARIATIEADNEKARRRAARRDVLTRLEAARESERQATRNLEDATLAREDAIVKADLGIEGLSFSEDGVLLGGQPIEQASTAEQIRASIKLAVRQNPSLGVVVCREGSLLDERSLALVAEHAAASGLQTWTEIVGVGKGGIVIEDGEVAATGGGK